MAVPVTGFYAGILALMLVVLIAVVVKERWRAKVGIGHGDDRRLQRVIRIHANFVENVPLALLLMGIVELGGLTPNWLHGLGVALVVGRILHVIGLSRTVRANPWRALGVVVTGAVLITGALKALQQFLSSGATL
jgi:uncharacterized membrane protein YecN with MAPEG domain